LAFGDSWPRMDYGVAELSVQARNIPIVIHCLLLRARCQGFEGLTFHILDLSIPY